MKQIILVSLFFIFYISGYANHPLVRNFGRDTYKAGTQNWAIVQDESNSMYFANNNGLLQFDGKNWNTFPIKNGTNVRSLVHTNDGRFYASTFNEFGYYQKKGNRQLEYYSLITKFGINKQESNELYNIQSGNDKIYFQGDRTVYQYDGKYLLRYPFHSKIDASAFIHNILFVTSEQSGVYMLNGNLFVRLPGSELLLNKKVCSIVALDGDNILLITNFNGVYLFNGNTILPYNTGIDDFLKQNQVFCAARNANQLVFGTVQRGIAVLNLTDRSVTYVNTFSGLQNNTVLSVAFDNQNNLWLGLDKGIDYVMLNSPIQNIFGTNNLYGAGYTSLLKNNILYMGTNQGLYSIPFPLPNSPFPIQPKLVKGMEGQIWCLTEINGTIFCGDDQGAFIIDGGRTERIEGLPGTWNFKSLQLHTDLIMGCSYQGLFVLKRIGERWKFSHFIKGKFSESSPMYEEDTDGTIWFSHWQKGMFRLHFNSKMDSITHVDNYNNKGFPGIQNNTVFRINNKLVFSSERGFYYFNRDKNRIDPYSPLNKIFSSAPSYMRLHECSNGDIWFVSGRFIGLAKKNTDNTYSMDSLTFRILQPKIITGFEHFNFIDNNRLILSTEDGFSWIDSRRGGSTKTTFKVFVDNIIVTNNSSSKTIVKDLYKGAKNSNKFLHSQNSLRFEFIAPEYRNEGLVQYSYMLENFDENWSEFTSNNAKEYTQLPKGHYTFKIRARDILESKEAVCIYSFDILPAWYESQVAIFIYIILGITGIVGIIMFINHRSQLGALEMEKRKEIELNEQKQHFEAETSEKKREIKELKNQQLQYELRHKSQELASSTMNLIRKNEILFEIMDTITKASHEIKNNSDSNGILSRLSKLERNIRQNIENDNNWKKFEENFDLVYENYLKRLGEMYPDLSTSDKKLCAYLKMDLSSKDIAPLLNTSIRGVETNRYRLRKKFDIGRDTNLSEFLQRF
ncbi:MAG: triple tyrosine motif-containing protein [Paludibacter sp.]